MKALHVFLGGLLCLIANIQAEEISIQIGGSVYSYGNANELTEISLSPQSCLLDALAAAGGCSEAARLKSVLVKRTTESGEKILTVDAIAALQDPPKALVLQEGDIIWVDEIVDGYPAPHYFNRLLFEWAYLNATKEELPTYWSRMVSYLDRLGHQRETRFREWSEPDGYTTRD